MKEIELKILNISVPVVTKRLLALGAKKKGTQLVIAEHFDFSDKRIHASNQILRLRKVGKKSEFCFKGKAQKSRYYKIVEEIETEVASLDSMRRILLKLGLNVRSYLEKKRTSFVLGNLKIEIDKYPDIPAYLEIEGPQKEIASLLPKIGYTLQDTNSMGADKVLKSYGVNSRKQIFR